MIPHIYSVPVDPKIFLINRYLDNACHSPYQLLLQWQSVVSSSMPCGIITVIHSHQHPVICNIVCINDIPYETHIERPCPLGCDDTAKSDQSVSHCKTPTPSINIIIVIYPHTTLCWKLDSVNQSNSAPKYRRQCLTQQ